jgi:hypothetical protein
VSGKPRRGTVPEFQFKRKTCSKSMKCGHTFPCSAASISEATGGAFTTQLIAIDFGGDTVQIEFDKSVLSGVGTQRLQALGSAACDAFQLQ